MLKGSRRLLRSTDLEYGRRFWRYPSTLACKHIEAQQGRVKFEEDEVLVCKVSSVLAGIGYPPPKRSSLCSPPHLSKHLAFFNGIGIHADGFCKIISAYPHALILDPDTDLKLSIAQLEAVLGKGLLVECILLWPALLGLGFPLESAQKVDLGIPNLELESASQGLASRQHGLEGPEDGVSVIDCAKDGTSLCVLAKCANQEGPLNSSSSEQDTEYVKQGLIGLAQQEFLGKIDCFLKCGFKRNTKLLAKASFCALHKSKRDVDAIVRAVMSLGLSRNHTGRLIKLQPPILQQTPVEITPKLDYILNTLGFSTEDLFKYSSFMLHDLESHIRPRYLMHRWIKSKRLLRRNFKLDYIMSMSERQFRTRFVECYEGGANMYHGFLQNGK